MRTFLRLLLVLTTLIWVVGSVPQVRACAGMSTASCCPVREPSCHMDCCREPVGDLYSGAVPAASSMPQMPAQPVAWRPPVLSNLKPVLIAAVCAQAGTAPKQSTGGPTKIYLLKRSLLI